MGRGDAEVGESKKREQEEIQKLDIESEESELDSFDDPLLNRLMTGAWAAVDEMSEDVNKDLSTVQEVVVMMRGLRKRHCLYDQMKNSNKTKIPW